MTSHSAPFTYLSTRGGSSGLSFRDVVLKGLAQDGGLFIPASIPKLPTDWESRWANLSFQDLAFEIMSLYISPTEIPAEDLKSLISRSYSTFRDEPKEVTPLVKLDKDKELYLLELFHGPTFAFKDVALQFVGNLFEYFLGKLNIGKEGKDRHHLTVVGATSGDTGSAAIYGLRGKKDVSIFILYPDGRVSPIQEAQMTTVLDKNVHCLSVEGSFDDCQDTVKALFADTDINSTHTLAAVNSINWARILAQITYYFSSYFALTRSSTYIPGTPIRYVVPSGNFGDILAGWFARQMGLPSSKLVIATNENDILDRFFKHEGAYTIQPVTSANEDPVQVTHSPAMDILVSSNFERLLWCLAAETAVPADLAECGIPSDTTSKLSTELSVDQKRAVASYRVRTWLAALKTADRGFTVTPAVFAAASAEFESERVSNQQTIDTIRNVFLTFSPPTDQHTTNLAVPSAGPVILDPHTAVGIHAALESLVRNPKEVHISLATAHPAKFASAVDEALQGLSTTEGKVYGYESMVQPKEFIGLDKLERKVIQVGKIAGLAGVKEIIRNEVAKEGN